MKVAFYWTAAGAIVTGFAAFAQPMTSAPTPLAALIAEAQTQNPQLGAADHAWKAATHVAQRVSTLPDPQFTVQSFSVGSPRPFAGFSNNDFAYIGLGASQEFPYAGKLRLKGAVADREADLQQAQAGLLRTSITEQVKLLYLRLAYLDATLAILGRNDDVLKPLIETDLSHYRLGQGSQADVLKAQIEHTKILREVTMHHLEMGQLQASLKELVHRPQTSPDIVAVALSFTPFERSAEELESLVAVRNPAVYVDAASVRKQDAQLKSAQRDGKPDWNAGYMFQQTGSGYRDYYMLTVSMNLPRHRRVEAEVAEAGESLEQSRQQLDSEVQLELAEVERQYTAATQTEELLRQYRDGLLPQSRAAFEAERTSYQSGKQAFAPVLSSLLDVLAFEHDDQQALFDHEAALIRLETLTGAELR